MSRLFGSLRQMGYVVTDVDGAMKHWIEVCGVGLVVLCRSPAADVVQLRRPAA
jgi:hypothetical protein